MTEPKQGEIWIRRRDGAKVRILSVNGARERGGFTIAAEVYYRKTRPEQGRRDVKLASSSLERFQKIFKPGPDPVAEAGNRGEDKYRVEVLGQKPLLPPE